MGRITIRETSADLPLFPEEMELTQVSSLGPNGGLVSHFELRHISMRTLELINLRLLDGKINSVRTEATSMRSLNVQSVAFTDCDLSSLKWDGGKISRTRFDSCRLLGARFDNVTFEHVVFTDCKMDYAMLNQVRASKPAMFIRCGLRETAFNGCDLSCSLFDECDLTQTTFGQGRYKSCDLRGNDLSALNGVQHLQRIIIDRIQLLQLTEALAADLNMTFGDDPNDPRGS
jgi:uncharacterized protein YjbI with pentapeptide repeats